MTSYDELFKLSNLVYISYFIWARREGSRFPCCYPCLLFEAVNKISYRLVLCISKIGAGKVRREQFLLDPHVNNVKKYFLIMVSGQQQNKAEFANLCYIEYCLIYLVNFNKMI